MDFSDILLEQTSEEEFERIHKKISQKDFYPDQKRATAKIITPLSFTGYDSLSEWFLNHPSRYRLGINDKGEWEKYKTKEKSKEEISQALLAEHNGERLIELVFNIKSKNDTRFRIKFKEIDKGIIGYYMSFGASHLNVQLDIHSPGSWKRICVRIMGSLKKLRNHLLFLFPIATTAQAIPATIITTIISHVHDLDFSAEG